MTLLWATAAVLASQLAAGSALATVAAEELREPPVCGHHDDIWGFSIDIPAGLCADRYLHGVSLRLSDKDDDFARLIVVFAIGNSSFLRSSSDLAKSYVEAARGSASGPVAVLSRAAWVVGETPGVRWTYRYREKASGRELLVDLVAVLRAVRPPRDPLDYYQYAFYLETTPERHTAERPTFEAVLRSVTFSSPDR
jgi:hypothetical protein